MSFFSEISTTYDVLNSNEFYFALDKKSVSISNFRVFIFITLSYWDFARLELEQIVSGDLNYDRS